MKIHMFEDFKQDGGTTIQQRYPKSGPTAAIGSLGFLMRKPNANGATNWLEAQSKLVGSANYHFLINYANEGITGTAANDMQHSFFDLFRLSNATTGNLVLWSR